MSRSVDERIVQMKFDNTQFEKNVSKSMGTLDKLKSKLNSLSGKETSTALDNLAKSANSIDFSGLANNIQSISDRFSTMGIVGMTVIQDITNSLLSFAKGTWNNVFGTIKSGGMQRALNIEQARFQMKGVLGDAEKVQAIMEGPVNTAVDGTAYGLDEAAKVASVLTASGITDLDKLETSLLAVSGAAAMTGRDYSEIGDIFSTVASNGKLMTQQLRQFSASGLNVSAMLAKELGKTEEEINDMVSKGKISFEQFSEAMNKAYGAHAKEANNTFMGAMANMKAAMKKIGADFATPYLEAARPVMLAIRAMFNRIREITKPFAESTWADSIKKSSETIVKFIDKINVNFVGRFLKMVETPLKSAPSVLRAVGKGLNAISTVISKLRVGPLNAVVRAFRDGFADTKILVGLHRFTDSFAKFAKNLDIDKKINGDIYRAFTGLIDGLKWIASGFKIVFSSLKPLLGELGSFGRELLKVASNVGVYISEWTKAHKEHTALKNFMSGFVSFLQGFVNIIKSLAGGIKNFAKTISDSFDGFGGGGGLDWFSKLGEKFKNFTDSISSMEVVSKLFQSITNIIINSVKSLSQVLTEFFNSDILTNGLRVLITTLTSSFLVLKGGGTFDYLLTFFRKFKFSVEALSPTKIANTIKELSWNLEVLQAKLSAQTLKEIAIAVGILTASMVALSSLDSEGLTTGLTGVGALLAMIVGVMKALTRIVGDITPVTKGLKGLFGGLASIGAKTAIMSVLATSMLKIAGSILILAFALRTISKLSWGDMAKGLVAVAVLMQLLNKAIDSMAVNTKSTKEASKGILRFAIGIVIIAAAVKMLGNMDIESLAKGLGGIALIFTALAVFSKNAEWLHSDGLISLAIAIAAIAVAVKALGNMELEDLAKGLIALGVALGEIVAFSKLAGDLNAGSILAAAGAITAIAISMRLLGGISWGGLIRGLIAIGGALAIVGVAGTLLAPLTPAIMSLGVALLAIGGAITLAGVGFIALGVGLATFVGVFAGSVSLLVQGFKSLLQGIVGLGPALVAAFTTIITSIVTSITNSATSIGTAVVVCIETLLGVLAEHGPAIGEHIMSILAALLLAINNYIPVLAEAGMLMIINFINSMSNAVMEHGDELIAAVENMINSMVYFALSAIQSIVEEIPLIGDKLGGVLEKAKNSVKDKMTTDEMANIGSEGAKKLASKSGDFESSGSTLGGAFTKGLTESTDEAALGGVGEKLLGSLDGLTGDFNTKGVEAMTGWGAGADSKTDEAAKSVDNVNDKALDRMKLARNKYVTEGGTGVKKIGEGMRDSKAVGEVRKAGENAGGKGVEGAKSKRKDFVSAGKDAASGYVEGINSKQSAVYSSGGNMAKWALMGTKERQKSASPAKEFAKLGDYAGEGYVVGVMGTLSDVRKATSKMAGSALDGMQSAIGRINDLIGQGDNFTPVIRPVVDLSGVAAGASQISGYFNSPTVSPYTDQVNAIVNGGVLGVTGQLNVASVKGNREVVDSIAEIRADIYDLNNAIRNMQLVLDTGATVGGIYQKMDAKLGQVQGYKGRNI